MQARFYVNVLVAFVLLEAYFILVADKYDDEPTDSSSIHKNAKAIPQGCSFYTREKRNSSSSAAVASFSVELDGRVYPGRAVPLYENNSFNFECIDYYTSDRPKVILMWTKFNGEPFARFDFAANSQPEDFFVNINCPLTSCQLTNDRSQLPHSQLVLFHLRNRIDYVPRRARADQLFVHVVYESPVHCPECARHRYTFNLSASYRDFSDFSSLYWTQSAMYWAPNPAYDTERDVHATKSRFAVTTISNCKDTLILRLRYIALLNEALAAISNSPAYAVDIYGKCGRKCLLQQEFANSTCRHMIATQAKFYLAFENSFCKDYITEKFFNTLKYDVVPVVLGGGDYEKFVPKSAFINALDFESPRHLADYLLYLDQNKTAYNGYFKWKQNVKFHDEWSRVSQGFLCEMCIRLHLEEQGMMPFKWQQLNKMEQMFAPNKNCKRATSNGSVISFVEDSKLKAEYITSVERKRK